MVLLSPIVDKYQRKILTFYLSGTARAIFIRLAYFIQTNH